MMVFRSYLKISIREMFAFRASFVLEIMTRILDVAIFLIFWWVILSSDPDLGMWSVYDILLLIALAELYMSIFTLLFLGFYVLPIYVVNGQLDDLLRLPVNPFVALTGDQLQASRFTRLFVALILLVISIIIHPQLSTGLLIIGLVVSTAGILLNNLVLASLNLLSFWIGRMGYILDIISVTDDALYFPLSRLKGFSRVVFFIVLPLYFVTTFPLQIMTMKITMIGVVAGCVALVLLLVAWLLVFQKLWVTGMTQYQSSGSL